MFLFLLLSQLAFADSFDNPQYGPAKKAILEGTLKQSGLEADFIKIKGASEGKMHVWLQKNGLEEASAVIGFGYNTLVKKQIRLKTGNVILNITDSKSEVTWRIQF